MTDTERPGARLKQVGEFMGFPIFTDGKMPPDEIEFRDHAGKVLGKLLTAPSPSAEREESIAAIRKWQRHILLRTYGDDGHVLPENLELSQHIDNMLSSTPSSENGMSAEQLARMIFKSRSRFNDEACDEYFEFYKKNPTKLDDMRMSIFHAYRDAEAVIAFLGVPSAPASNGMTKSCPICNGTRRFINVHGTELYCDCPLDMSELSTNDLVRTAELARDNGWASSNGMREALEDARPSIIEREAAEIVRNAWNNSENIMGSDAAILLRAYDRMAAALATLPPVPVGGGKNALDMLNKICDEIFERWDKDQRPGKLLTALAGRIQNYRDDVTHVRNVLGAEDKIPENRVVGSEQEQQGPRSSTWSLIETAPKGRMLIGGNFNSLGKWRSYHMTFYGPEELESDYEESGFAAPGWYEGSLEAEELQIVSPTHYHPLPSPPLANDGPRSGEGES